MKMTEIPGKVAYVRCIYNDFVDLLHPDQWQVINV